MVSVQEMSPGVGEIGEARLHAHAARPICDEVLLDLSRDLRHDQVIGLDQLAQEAAANDLEGELQAQQDNRRLPHRFIGVLESCSEFFLADAISGQANCPLATGEKGSEQGDELRISAPLLRFGVIEHLHEAILHLGSAGYMEDQLEVAVSETLSLAELQPEGCRRDGEWWRACLDGYIS